MKTTSLFMMLLMTVTLTAKTALSAELIVGEKIITSMGQVGIVKNVLNDKEAVVVFSYPEKTVEMTVKSKYVARTTGCTLSNERICVGDKVIHNALKEVTVLGIYGNGVILMESNEGHLISANEKIVAATTGCLEFNEVSLCVGNVVKNKFNEAVEIVGLEKDDHVIVKKHNRFQRMNVQFLRH